MDSKNWFQEILQLLQMLENVYTVLNFLGLYLKLFLGIDIKSSFFHTYNVVWNIEINSS